jgi:ribosome-associated protein
MNSVLQMQSQISYNGELAFLDRGLAQMLIVTRHIQIPLAEFEITFARSSGPGGQNVNKVNSKAILRWAVRSSRRLPDAVRQRFLQKYGNRLTTEGELLVTSQRFRDASRNSHDCLEKLRVMLLGVAHPPKSRRATRPTRGSVERRLQGKRRQSAAKQDRRLRDEN